MNIQAVKSMRAPRYPSLDAAAACPGLLEVVPKRWTASPGLAVALGLGLLARPVELQADEEPGKPAAAAARALPGKGDAAEKATETNAAAGISAWVAPVLAEALEQDGRGAFGCVAVSPPVVLSEAEAVEIIQAELKAAGLNPELNVKVDGVFQPVETSPFSTRTTKRGRVTTISSVDDTGPAELQRKAAVFDLGDRERSVFVEFLSLKDHEKWMGRSMSTVSSYDFPGLVPIVAEAYGRRAAEKREIYGIFFDPLAHRPWNRNREGIQGLTPAQARLAEEEARAKAEREAASLPERSREKLREQVRFFVKQLREKGVLPPA